MPERSEHLLDLPVPPLTRHTVRDRATLEKLVAAVRRDGYSIQRNETSLGLGVVSVPLFKAWPSRSWRARPGFSRRTVSRRIGREPAWSAALHDAARAISQRLGCGVYPFGAGSPRPVMPEHQIRWKTDA